MHRFVISSALVLVALHSLIFHSLFNGLAFAQTSWSGARDAAVAGSSVAAVATGWSEANPAGWSQLGLGADVHVAQLYGLEELRLGAVQLALSMRRTSIVAGARTFGYNDYRATDLTVGAARAFFWGTHRPLHVGLRLRYHGVAIPSYGSASAYSVSAGVIFPVVSGIALGVAAENLLVLAGPLGDALPRRLHAGASVRAGVLTMLASASKDVTTQLTTRVGIEAQIVEAVLLRAGYSLLPPRFAGGLGLRLSPLTVDLAAERHFVLGWSPSCSVGMRW